MLDKAVDNDVNEAWDGTNKEVPNTMVPSNSNIVGSHFVYETRIKKDEKRLKARLRPHGNCDLEKGIVQKDSSTAQFDIICLLASTAAKRDNA